MAKKKLTLGEFVAREREKLGLSQSEFAKKCSIPSGTVASIESGYAKSPRSVTLKKLAEGLDIPLEVLFRLASMPDKEVFVDFDEIRLLKMPVLGHIPSEGKLLSLENAESYISFPSNFVEDGDFLLLVKGDDFNQEDLFDNDYVVIKNLNFLKRSGDLMVIRMNNKVTLVRVYKSNDSYKLNSLKSSPVKPEKIEFIGKAITSISLKKL